MINYRQAELRDMESIIDLANMVFSMLRVPHNFSQMLPKVYAAPNLQPQIHVIAEEEGRLVGCLGMLVFPLRMANETLRVGYLGTMAVHPRVRGRGTMGELMEKQIKRGKELGLDMLVLGGQRQRYARHGFETCGANYVYSISKANVRHAYSDVSSEGVTFRLMQPSDASTAYALYDRQRVAGAREIMNFVDVLKSYGRAGWIIELNGEIVGYLCASSDLQTITELVLDNAELLPGIIKGWSEKTGGKLLHIHAAPHDVHLNERLAPVCEGYSLTPNCMIRVLNPKNVIKAYLELKNTYVALQPGVRIISWEGMGVYRIEIEQNGGIDVNECGEKADVVLTDRQAHQIMFDYNPYTSRQKRKELDNNWFPLPFHISEPDSF
ncbi:MAG: GNAT family N-acetyltransferase [Clostridia bacterium]|nr:GNAT family N-acetyltransferase [Clostridia bacterium]